jgi:hypothetical protein
VGIRIQATPVVLDVAFVSALTSTIRAHIVFPIRAELETERLYVGGNITKRNRKIQSLESVYTLSQTL